MRQRMLFVLSGLSALLMGAVAPVAAFAQSSSPFGGISQPGSDAQLLLQSDEIVYDNDNRRIIAIGDVRIDYDGTQLAAERVVYDEASGRLVARGSVEILQPDGTRVFADEIDVTDDFRDGFVEALRVVTADNTRFAANTGERRDGNITVFNQGLYTACEPCRERSDRPPIWQVKAQRIILNGEEKTVRFESARFEFFGVPIAAIPVFTTADPSVKRKSGFLFPGISYGENLGYGVTIPYFLVLGPTADVTLKATGYTQQGFLGEAEFRKQFDSGLATLKIAGIQQQDADGFAPNTVDAAETTRGTIGSTGDFRINSRWTFGWDVMAQTDKNFSHTYRIEGYDQALRRNNVYLNGLGTRSAFEAEIINYDQQETALDPAGSDRLQPVVLPSIDHAYTVDRPVAGGTLAFDTNIRAIDRRSADIVVAGGSQFATEGADGRNGRITTQAEWKRNITTPGGLVLTPILHARGDASFIDVEAQTAYSATGAQLTTDNQIARGMITAGMEARWPILFSTSSATHVLEPVAQVFVRPDVAQPGMLPNEDAQSLVFDATSLFERDKFSGFDRIESGHRANLGLRYTGSFGNGMTLHGVFGQSYHLGGDNPFAQPDFVNAGAYSGLETKRSDYVASLGLNTGTGLTGIASVRFDDDDFELKRAAATVNFAKGPVSAGLAYGFTREDTVTNVNTGQPVTLAERHEATISAGLRFADHWRTFGSASYDFVTEQIDQQSIGLSYDDECFAFTLNYSETFDSTRAVTRNVSLRLSLRTLGDFDIGSNTLGLNN